MSTTVETEEIATTRSEKFLAVVLVAFLLIGSIWTYVKIAEWVGTDSTNVAAVEKYDKAVNHSGNLMDEADEADRVADDAKTSLDIARDNYLLARQTNENVKQSKAELTKAESLYKTAQETAIAQRKLYNEAQKTADELYDKAYNDPSSRATDVRVAALRAVFILLWLGLSFVAINRLRQRGSRSLPVAFSFAATGTILALVFAVDYVLFYIDPLNLGPIVLSLMGAGATIAAFVVLQRFLARRIPGRRVRKGECPFCGFPVEHHGNHCVGCGRQVVGQCSSCGDARRVGSPHCAHCGNS